MCHNGVKGGPFLRRLVTVVAFVLFLEQTQYQVMKFIKAAPDAKRRFRRTVVLVPLHLCMPNDKAYLQLLWKAQIDIDDII